MTNVRTNPTLVRLAVILALSCLPWLPSAGSAAELRVPTEGNESGLYTVEVLLTASDSLSAEIQYDVNKLQYAGATPPDPDIQLRSDGLVEISARSGERRYRLKFLMLPQQDDALLTFRHGSLEQRAVIQRRATAVAGGYHLHLLGFALFLLVFGVYLWKYQSRQIDLMSTRSLFYTYEELERLRRKHETAKPAEESESAVREEATPPEPPPPEPPPPPSPSAPVIKSERPSESPAILELLAPLRVVITDEQGRSYSGQGTEITIGRRKDCQIVVSAAEVSRTHVCIRRRGREYELVPLATTNTTRVNGTVVTQPSKVASGDTVTLGGAVYRLSIEG